MELFFFPFSAEEGTCAVEAFPGLLWGLLGLFVDFLLTWELSEPEELSDPLDDEELESEEELFEDVEVDAEVLPLARGFGGILSER